MDGDGFVAALRWARMAVLVALLVMGGAGLIEFVDHAEASNVYPGIGTVGVASAIALVGAGGLITALLRERRPRS